VRWHKLREVDNKYALRNSIVLAICKPKIIKFGGDLTKFWQKQVGSFLAHPAVVPKMHQYTSFSHQKIGTISGKGAQPRPFLWWEGTEDPFPPLTSQVPPYIQILATPLDVDLMWCLAWNDDRLYARTCGAGWYLEILCYCQWQ